MSIANTLRRMVSGFRRPRHAPEHHGHEVAQAADDALHAAQSMGSATSDAVTLAGEGAERYDDSFER